ncbi:iron chelate uptake ABC transporter family permease subunit [Cellulomonas sp. ATA003]|uniref:iron chelate uptake ABC transporter family permease subunit n=1 Tax=Cellulomonas sp. ATA003 TaxID=3073064 RepID=UPI002872D95E|nr:iron chelate uptake ABC transporter family permease subunit [Cellulomonas sp. ATA003]WNB84541.1 iron chelate uptake ABC transporter family permease subunit [Cellulomonas sp. ATA003]
MLLAVVVGLGVTALAVGPVALTPGEVLGALAGAEGRAGVIVLGLRAPRLALALVVGAALGLAGALLQSVVRNPLASPDVVGLTGGASAAAVLAIAAGASGTAVDAAALGGALLAAVAVFGFSGRGVTGTRFIVVGVAVAFLANGFLGYGLTRASLAEAQSAFFWLVGSVGTAPWGDVARVAAVLGLVGVVLVTLRRPLSAVALDDDSARAIGARPVATRVAAIVLSSVLAAVAVAVAGPVAFVAFVSGPIARRLRGHGPALVTAPLVGGVVVVAADLVAQHLIPGSLEPPVGLVTGVLGAPFLIWLLVRGEQRKEMSA